MRLLLTGDLHIGRTSTRVPSELPQSDRSAAGAWNRIVRLATEEACDVVCLSGDVADQSNKFWEAIGPLEAGVTTLAEAGIQVVAVTGNHDHDVLPRLADQLPDGLLTLLGRGGRWERTTLEGDDGRPSLHLDGWSFPKARVTDDPLAAYDLPHDGAVPTLGLVHGDLDLSTSPYAPLSRERLRRAAPDAWLLGHVHVPGLHDLDAGGWALYPGSPQALDPGEPGPHGPWIVEVQGGRIGTPRQVPTSTVRYDRLNVDLSGSEDADRIASRVRSAIRDAAERCVDEATGDLRWVSLRLRLVGTAPSAEQIAAATEGLADDLRDRVGDATVEVEAVTDDTLPAIDLTEHAATRGAPGVLARLLLDLDAESPSEATDAWLREARAAIRDVDADRSYGSLGDDPDAGGLDSGASHAGAMDGDAARDLLRRQARAMLRRLTTDAS